MRNHEAERFTASLEKDVKHMLNNGNRRDKIVEYMVNKMVKEDTTFTSRQVGTIFRMIL